MLSILRASAAWDLVSSSKAKFLLIFILVLILMCYFAIGNHDSAHYQRTKLKVLSMKTKWKVLLNVAIALLTALATALGVSSCYGVI